ncbi:MAG: hypothetical protein HYV59_05705, partial [Planctomycetes bacterium]|nr:hypothetical protein [Planctomycetota bacterium]
MRWIIYTLLACTLIEGSDGRPFVTAMVYGEVISTTDKDSQQTSNPEGQEVTAEGTKEIRIRKDEFDEIVGQLQGMKTLLENMKQDYDTRFKEMKEKIATLEKEKTELEKKQLEPTGAIHELPPPKTENEFPVAAVEETEALKVSVTKDERPVPSQTDASTTSPLPPQTTAGSIVPPISTTPPDQPVSPGTGQWSPAQPITVWSMGKNYMNISFDGLFSVAGSTAEALETLETGGHDPIQRGFNVQNLETVFEGAIDPYFKGQANIVFQIDKDGESFLEVEEAYLTSMSLPLNLQVKAGTFFTEFGRLNPFHPHTWDFADQPLVNGRFLGPDGMRNPGVRLSWLAPTDNYTELFFTVQDSQGETAHSFRNEEALFGRE